MNTNTYTNLIELLQELDTMERQKKALEAQINSAKELVKEYMTSSNKEVEEVGGYKVMYKAVISKRFDTSSFKNSYKSLYEEFIRPQTSYRLTIN